MSAAEPEVADSLVSPARLAFLKATPNIPRFFPEPLKDGQKRMDQYKEIRIIGRGNYGTAHLVKDLNTGRKLVVKKIPQMPLSEKEKKEAWSEIQMLSRLSHPNIIQYVTSFLEDDILHIVTSFCNGGDLSQVIKARKELKSYFEEDDILDIFIQLAMAVDYCHAMRVMHRDLKTSNVFITRKNVVKLGDFGIAKLLDDDNKLAKTVVGTPFYMSPEVCENKPYDFKSDVWALGCILYELCALEPAFGASSLLAVVKRIVQEAPAPIPDMYSADLQQLLKSLLAKNPNDRPTIKNVFKLPFIRERLESLARDSLLPVLDHPDEDVVIATGSKLSAHRRDSSTASTLLKTTGSSITSVPPLPTMASKLRRSNSTHANLDQAMSTTTGQQAREANSSPSSAPPPFTQPRRESPPTSKIKHHSRSRSSILVRPTEDEFASSPVASSNRARFDSEDLDSNDAKLVLEEVKLRSEGVERTSQDALLLSRRSSHARSNSTINSTSLRGSSASAVSTARHSRTGSAVTALSLDM